MLKVSDTAKFFVDLAQVEMINSKVNNLWDGIPIYEPPRGSDGVIILQKEEYAEYERPASGSSLRAAAPP
jgi:hypothetical protein